MICLRLFVALLTATAAVIESKGDEFLIFASIGENGFTTFYKTLIDLKHPTKLLTIPNVSQPVDNLFVNLNSISNFLFWSYKDSDNIGYLNVLNNKDWKLTAVEDAENGVFLGLGDNDKIFVYLNKNRKIRAYNFKNTTSLWDWDMNWLKDEETDMQCIDRDPCHKELLLFAACSETLNAAYIIDIETQTNLHKIPLTYCYEIWRIAPNGKTVFATRSTKLYMSESKQKFKKWLDVGSKIIDLAVGKNYLFVITKQSKVFRIDWSLKEPKEEDLQELKHDIKGKLTNIIVNTTSKDIC